MTKEQRNIDYLRFFEQVEVSKQYMDIQPYFGVSHCVYYELIGYMIRLCRNSQTNCFIECYEFYLLTIYYENLTIATERLQCILHSNGIYYNDTVVRICLKTFIIYKTWIGCQMERQAILLIKDKDFYCIHANRNYDIYNGIDLFCVYQGKWAFAIQVKSDSYRENETDKRRIQKFVNRYHLPVIYLKYDRHTKRFPSDELEKVEKIKKNIRDNGKAGI